MTRKRHNGTPTTHLGFWLDHRLVSRARQVAASQDIDLSKLIRRALRRELGEIETHTQHTAPTTPEATPVATPAQAGN